MSNKFCGYLSNGYSFNSNQTSNKIQVKPCCWFSNSITLDSDFAKKRDHYKDIQDWTPACNHCKLQEEAGQQSLRQSSFDWINNKDHDDPIAIDINLDKTCNAACVICNDHSSTLWYKEKQKLKNKSFHIKIDTLNIDNKINEILQSFDFSKLRYIKFFGGEPLFTDTHLKFLTQLPNPENITVHYTTNGSIFPSLETQAVWDRFKTIIFSASLDGTEQQFDYIRWPLTWAKVSENLLCLRAKKLHNVMFRVEFTVNFLNAWYFDRLQQWVNDNWATNEFNDPTEINVHPCQDIFALTCMPDQVRAEILKKYPRGHVIHNLVANLPDPLSLDPFNEFINTWELRRKQDWQQSFKEIEYLFQPK